MTIDQLAELLKLAHQYNLKTLKIEDVAIEFNKKEDTAITTTGLDSLIKSDKMPTEDEMLYWSSTGAIIEEEKEATPTPQT